MRLPVLAALAALALCATARGQTKLLKVSYDPTP